jgi:type VI secretion system secreted protein Hcp
MPKQIAMTLEGSSSGKISDGASNGDSIGGLARSGDKADACLVYAYQDQIVRPTDPQTGQPTGNRIHRGIKVTKILDKTSPILRQAITPANSETFDVEFKFYRQPEGGGAEEHYYTITLSEAVVVDIVGWTPNALDPDKKDFVDMEDVTFTYKKIVHKHEVASAESEDDTSAT